MSFILRNGSRLAVQVHTEHNSNYPFITTVED